jgi:hypothetical protein
MAKQDSLYHRLQFPIIFIIILLVGGCVIFNNMPSKSGRNDKTNQLLKLKTPSVTGENFAKELQTCFKLKKSLNLSPVDLRGYGPVSGRFMEFDESLSMLEIRAESESKAALWQAKYESDLRNLGGVTDKEIEIGGKKLKINEIADQGATVSFRHDNEIFILSSKQAEIPKRALEFAAAVPGAEFESSAKVPMYLDSWDQHAFRFYYRPWEMPKDKKVRENYDIIASEFDYAKKQGDLGFVLWANENQMDFAEGINNDLWWDWAARAAQKRQLPTVINVMTGASTWLLNDYRPETSQKMPQYCGSFHSIAEPYHGGTGNLSWCAEKSKDIELALLKRIVSKYAKQENVLDFLEPHGELQHGAYDIFLEYGELADKSYQKYLKQKYGELSKVSERWYGNPEKLKSWDEIEVPEVASFAGWGKSAIDLTGDWKVAYEPLADKNLKVDNSGRGLTHKTIKSETAPADWFKVDFDDKSWPTVTAPGHDRTMFLDKRPAVYRRGFNVSKKWLKKHSRVWLYVWDLNYGRHKVDKVYAYLNGKKAGEDYLLHATPHWGAFEVTKLIKAGNNQLTIRLPKGFLAYRTYLSPKPPKQYPDLSEELNAQWVDFSDWRGWIRLEMARRGIEMIREIAPDRGIVCMAPDGYFAGIKELCEDYGAHFHNTGHMGGTWNEFLPMLMRSSGLPFSLEPGGPAKDLKGFKRMMGHYLTEGINAIHYFIHIGSIIWEPQIKAHFEKILPMLKDLGRIHIPKSEAAMLMSERVNKLTGYPWGKDPNTNLASGYWVWRINQFLLDDYSFDGLSEKDFARGNAKPYKFIVDMNTSIMDEKLFDEIENWVKDGGIFVAFIQTGRHTPEKKDAWPISKLTGYQVTGISRYNSEDESMDEWRVKYAPGQKIFNRNMFNIDGRQANGLKMKKIAPECENLILWDDDYVAAGLRPYGKGYVITLGMKFCKGRIWHDGTNITTPMFQQIMEWAKLKPVPAYAKKVMTRSFVSNNGLYNAWTMWNTNDQEITTDLIFRKGRNPDYCINVETGEKVVPEKLWTDYGLKDLKFGVYDSKMFLAPRKELLSASLDWFKLQRSWWKGTRKPSRTLPEYQAKNALELTEDWTFKPVDPKEILEVEKYVAVDFDDSKWNKRRLGVWIVPEELDARHVIFRKKFKVPADWTNGKIYLWLRAWFSDTLMGKMRVWLDGKEIRPLTQKHGIDGLELDLKPDSEHVLAVEIEGTDKGSVCGPKGNTFLAYIPNPVAKEDLSGEWQPSKDAMNYGKPIKLPGGKWDAQTARRKIVIPKKYQGKEVYLHMDTSPSIIGALINGHWLRRHHHRLGNITHLNITPWVKFGKNNEFELEVVQWGGSGKGEVKELSLYFYDKNNNK